MAFFVLHRTKKEESESSFRIVVLPRSLWVKFLLKFNKVTLKNVLLIHKLLIVIYLNNFYVTCDKKVITFF